MKKLILFTFFLGAVAVPAEVVAQQIPPASIADSLIGWKKIYHFKGAKAGTKIDNRVYSANQLSICDSFANWMQASYIPKGGLGDVIKSVSEKLGLYNQHTAGKPQIYGAYAKTYQELKYNSSGKFEPFTNSHSWWGVFANNIPGDWPVRDICTPTQYYFTLPTAETEEEDKKIKQLLDLTTNSTTKSYPSFWVKNMGFGGGKEHVLLSKDNKSPFIKITKGEYLQALEAAIPRYYEAQKKKISEAEQGVQSRMAIAIKQLDEKIEGYKTGLKNNREKYKQRLGEPAMTSYQPGLTDLANGRDVFSSNYLADPETTSARYAVYTIDPARAALCKQDKPQWILISWEYYPNDPMEKQQHESIINNFNFAYVYNFFFDPEKVKGQPYTPLRSPYYKATAIVGEASGISKKNAADKNIHFFEDFSTTPTGSKPIGWETKMAFNGSFSVVESPEGLEGHWATLAAGHTIIPKQLPKPLPPNFTLSYELVAPQNFTWGAKGLIFTLSNETSPGNPVAYLQLKLRPGSGGSNGEATLETKFTPSAYLNGSKWLTATGFSNNQKNNHITVTIKKLGEKLELYIDKTKIGEYEKAIPAPQLFNTISFYTGGGDNEQDKYYISNIKITKE